MLPDHDLKLIENDRPALYQYHALPTLPRISLSVSGQVESKSQNGGIQQKSVKENKGASKLKVDNQL